MRFDVIGGKVTFKVQRNSLAHQAKRLAVSAIQTKFGSMAIRMLLTVIKVAFMSIKQTPH